MSVVHAIDMTDLLSDLAFVADVLSCLIALIQIACPAMRIARRRLHFSRQRSKRKASSPASSHAAPVTIPDSNSHVTLPAINEPT